MLDIEVRFPEKKSFVCGFADKEGKPYFLSLGMPKQVTPETVGIVVGGAGGVTVEELERGAVKAVGEIKPPELLKKVDSKTEEGVSPFAEITDDDIDKLFSE